MAAEKPLKLQILVLPSRARHVFPTVPPTTTIAQLQQLITEKTSLSPSQQSLYNGFPPKEIDTSSDTSRARTLAAAGIRSGDTVEVREAAGASTGAEIKQGKGWEFPSTIDIQRGSMQRRDMPRDNCLGEDHQVLTSSGFLFVDEVKQQVTNAGHLDIACYNTETEELEYHPITAADITDRTGNQQLVHFNNPASGVDLVVTALHDMFVRVGSDDGTAVRWRNALRDDKGVGHSKGDAFVKQRAGALVCDAVTGELQPFKPSLDRMPDPSCHRIKFLSYAAQGFDAPLPVSELPFVDALGLETEDHIDAFLEYYGYWLSDGCLNGEHSFIEVAPNKVADWEYLDSLFLRLGDVLPTQVTPQTHIPFAEKSTASRGVGCVRVDPRPPVDNGEKAGPRRTYRIYGTRWWTYFAEQYGHKYAGAAALAATAAGIARRGGSMPKPRYSPTMTAEEAAAIEAVEDEEEEVVRAMSTVDDDLAGEIDTAAQYEDEDEPSSGRKRRSSTDSDVSNSSTGRKRRSSSSASTEQGEVSSLSKSSLSISTPMSVAKMPETPETDEPTSPPPPDAETMKSAKWTWWWVQHLGKEKVRLLLKGLRFADGYQTDSRASGGRITTSSARFRDELIVLMLKAGYAVHFSKKHSVGKQCGLNKRGVPIVARHDHWTVCYTTAPNLAAPTIHTTRDTEVTSTNARVWCVTVPQQDQLIVVRRVKELREDGRAEVASRPVIVGNSCLFHSVAFLAENRATGAPSAAKIREIVANLVASDPTKYSTSFLGSPNHLYQQHIMNPDTWGGAIELAILSTHYQCEIVAFDYHYLREDIFGRDSDYKRRIFILYHGDHYDAIVWQSQSSSSEQVIFSTRDDNSWLAARNYVQSLHTEAAKKGECQLQKDWRTSEGLKRKDDRTAEKERIKRAKDLQDQRDRDQKSNENVTFTERKTQDGGASGREWQCKECTLTNTRPSLTCSVCGAPSPFYDEDSRPAPAQPTAAARNPSQPQPQPQLSSSSSSLQRGQREFVCNMCTFHNPSNAARCEMCGEPNPTPPPNAIDSFNPSASNGSGDGGGVAAMYDEDGVRAPIPQQEDQLIGGFEPYNAASLSAPVSRPRGASSPSMPVINEAVLGIEWSCPTCTQFNQPYTTACVSCQNPHPLLFDTTATSTSGRGGSTSRSGTVTPPTGGWNNFFAREERWICESCGTDNIPNLIRCKVCKAPNVHALQRAQQSGGNCSVM